MLLKNVAWTRCCVSSNRIFKRSTTACLQKQNALNARLYNTYAMSSPSKPKPIGFPTSTKTGWFVLRERKKWRLPRAYSFSKTIPLGAVAPRRHAPWRVLHQPQRPRPIKRPQRPAVILDSCDIDSLTLSFAFTLPLTQFLQNFRRAYSLSCQSIVVPQLKRLSGLPYDDGPRCELRSSRRLAILAVLSSRFVSATLTGWSPLEIRPSATDYAPCVSLSRGKPLG